MGRGQHWVTRDVADGYRQAREKYHVTGLTEEVGGKLSHFQSHSECAQK